MYFSPLIYLRTKIHLVQMLDYYEQNLCQFCKFHALYIWSVLNWLSLWNLSDSSDKCLDPTNFLILLSFLWTTLKVKELRFIQVYVWSSVNFEVKCCLWKYGSSIFSNSLRKIYQGLLKNSLLGFKQSLWAATGFIVIKLCLVI